MPRWSLKVTKFDDNGELMCGPFCLNLPCTDGRGTEDCIACTTLLCNPIPAFTLPIGVSAQTFAFPGVEVGDTVFLASSIPLPPNVFVQSVVAGNDVLTVTFDNQSGVLQSIPAQEFNAVVTSDCSDE